MYNTFESCGVEIILDTTENNILYLDLRDSIIEEDSYLIGNLCNKVGANDYLLTNKKCFVNIKHIVTIIEVPELTRLVLAKPRIKNYN